VNAGQRVRAEFLAAGTTYANRDGDFSAWHRGRTHFAVWAIAVDDPRLTARLAEARLRFGTLLRGDYARQPHITLQVCGFPCRQAAATDDYGLDRLAGQARRLAASGVGPFDIALGACNSFAAAPFFEVADRSASLARLRDALEAEHAEERSVPYVPHLTLGLYAAETPVATVLPCIDACVAAPIALRVERIELMAYESSVIGGPLTTLCSFDLAQRRIVWPRLS